MKIHELAKNIGAKVFVPQHHTFCDSLEISDIAPLDTAVSGEISFLTNPKMTQELKGCKASAVILGQKKDDLDLVQLVHANPRLAMTLASQIFYQRTHSFTGQSKMAYISESAVVDPSACIYPFAFIGEHAKIGKDVTVYPHVYVGEYSDIGDHSVLYPNAVLMDHTKVGRGVIIHGGAILGADGFGFTPDEHTLQKIPQKGHVVIEDGCEIGAASTIDRATFLSTRVRKGSKLDSQVHLGHNVDLGEHSMLCGQVGVAGSTKIGSRFIAAGQSAIGPGLDITDGVILGPRSGLTQSQATAGEVMGMPVVPSSDWRKQSIALKKLPDLFKKINRLEKKIESLLEK